jgi:TatD DNase family protein
VSSENQYELIDSHCHLNLPEFEADLEQVVIRARHNGVTRIVVPGVDSETSKTAIEYSKMYPGIFAAIGIHPNSGSNWNTNSISKLRLLSKEASVVAIGEIGLDYYRDYCPRNKQREILGYQLELAAELELPVIIHFRDSAEDLVQILVNWHESLVKGDSPLVSHPGVLHSFSGNQDMAEKMTSRNFKLGIGGPVTFRNSKTLQEIVTCLPLDSMLLETDAPYLSPDPFRGKRNEPTNVRIVAEKIALLKGIPVEQVAVITSQESVKLFFWGGSH